MSTGVRLTAFAVLLAVMVLVGALVGRAVGPIDTGGGHDAPVVRDRGGDTRSGHGGHGGGR